MRIVVITSCTGEKVIEHPQQLTLTDFRSGCHQVAAREQILADVMRPAEELYSGLQHVRLMRGIRAVREAASVDIELDASAPTVDLWILSAGYGLVPGKRVLAPYEATFQGMSKKELRSWADQLGVPVAIRELLARPYDLGLVLLGDSYLEACRLDGTIRLGGPTLLFCGKNVATRLPAIAGLHPVILANADAKRFSCGLVGLKGEVAARLLEQVSADPQTADQLTTSSVNVLEVAAMSGGSVAPAKRVARVNPSVDFVIRLPSTWRDKPHREKLRYFIPEWNDLVDPDFDFLTDTHAGGMSDWSNEVYAHQLYPEPNYDGILVSKVVAEDSRRKKARINELGVHRYLRVPREFPIMGDCGAFGYIQQEVPPYTTDEILDYYSRLGFDYGVSVDHLIVTATEAQKQFRYELTIQNAEEFLTEHRARGLPWEPIGAVQGWDPASYATAARQYVQMGYRYIALGGLVRTSTRDILKVLEAVHEVVPEQVQIHLFGLARMAALEDFARLGVRSVDSASYHRQAWMRTAQSYLLPTGAYAALRIPESEKSFRAKNMALHADADPELLRRLEADALSRVRAFARRDCSLGACLDSLLAYDQYVTRDRVDMTELYRRTLSDRPWEQCDCSLCKAHGIEVIIFRGNNRNRRRGFHNTYVFFRLLQRILAGEWSPGQVRREADQLPLFSLLATGTS